MNSIARTISQACLLWMLLYLLIGGTDRGRTLFRGIVSESIADCKGAVIMIMLVFPILSAASVCSLLTVRERKLGVARNSYSFFDYRSTLLRPFNRKLFVGQGDEEIVVKCAALFFAVSCTAFAIGCILRQIGNLDDGDLKSLYVHFRNRDSVSSKLTKGMANTAGMLAMVVFPFFLVPVSKHGPINRLFGWNPARMVQVHIWCGRLIVVGSTLHGLLHAIRWKYIMGESVHSFVFPPRECWTLGDTKFAPHCKGEGVHCTCQSHFLYFTGIVGVFVLLGILGTSFGWFRRRFYSVFYTCHVVLAPLFLVIVIFHYKRAILYFAPSILYYLATSMPVMVERQTTPSSVALDKVEVLGSGTNKCVSLTFAADPVTVTAYRAGMYVNLLAPQLSQVSHPFTVNKVPGRDDQLRIVFRSVGSFTRALADQLEAGDAPAIHLDGFHGGPDRLGQLLRHDTTLLFAGGIGITPFLSLLSDLMDGSNVAQYNISKASHNVVLHWMCRDRSLVDFVRREYLEPLRFANNPNCNLDVQIHFTGSADDSCIKVVDIERLDTKQKKPFHLSKFYPANNVIGNWHTFMTQSIILWVGMTLIWFFYRGLQSNQHWESYLLAPVVLLAILYLVSIAGVAFPVSVTMKTSKSHKERFSDEESLLLMKRDSADSYTSDEENPPLFRIQEHNTGRPDIRQLVGSVKDTPSLGIFACGPPQLSSTLSSIAAEREELSDELDHEYPGVTLYEDVFLM